MRADRLKMESALMPGGGDDSKSREDSGEGADQAPTLVIGHEVLCCFTAGVSAFVFSVQALEGQWD